MRLPFDIFFVFLQAKQTKKMRSLLLHIAFLLLGAVFASAQSIGDVRRVSSADGLSNDFVLCVCTDGEGYVWVATESGLNRISGKWCRVFQTNKSVSGQRIASLYYHAESGKMLIGTESGLAIYDCRQDVMIEKTDDDGLLAYSLDGMAPASDGGVWLVYGNGHVQHLDCNSGEVSNLQLKDYYGNRCGMDDGQGHFYLGHSQQGMTIVNLKDNSTRRFIHDSNNDLSLPGNNVRCILRDSKGRVWVGTDQGMAAFNVAEGTFTKVERTDGDYDDNVYDIEEMEDGRLWVATDMGGVRVVNPDAQGELLYENTDIQTSSINVRSITRDDFGNIWIGNYSTGVDFISAQKPLFQVMGFSDDVRLQQVSALANDRDGGFWMGSQNELSRWKDMKLVERWNIQRQSRREHVFPRCLMADRSGNVWLGMDDEGVLLFHPQQESFERIDLGHEGYDVHSFAEDSQGRIWIGTEFGVYTYYQGKVTFEDVISRITRNAPVSDFIWLSNEEVYMGTVGMGAYIFNLRTMDHKSLLTGDSLASNKINQSILGRDGELWIGTAKGLVCVEEPLKLKGVTVYDKSNGLADNHIRALQQDRQGRIWVSTFSGIACLDNDRARFYNYNYNDDRYLGGFANGAAIITDDGSVCFGSASGVCRFQPRDMEEHSQVSAVQIVSCEAYNPVGSDTQIAMLHADDKGRVRTTYRQNTLRLTFTLRNYAQLGWGEYSYMMKGMDSKWYYINNDQDVVFRGLRPGRYTFILRGKLKSQDWDEASETQLEIIITPPFWKTWWAYLLYILTAVLWIWYVARSYKRRLTLRNSLEMERHESLQKQEMNEERLRFFTNVTHELRTPLTLILGPLDDLAGDSQLTPQNQRRVQTIQKSAQQLLGLINEVLEFRKTETQNRRLTVARGDIGPLLRETCLNYKELYRNPKVMFSYDIPDNLPKLYFDSEIVTSILNNFLSNAIKYTEEGSITVVAKADENQLTISVSDTGYGIASKALPHIFERYYQAKGSHQASGTGIGLALVKSLADLHEARLSVDSQEGKGSCFSLSLGISNTYPQALHKEDAEEMRNDDREGLLLIVEDNADIRQYIADSFSEDFRILQATNGQEGLQMALEHIPDIIVSDIMMPHMNGIEMTKKVKANISTSHIPVILLTAKVTDEDKEEGYDSGADSYLTKPFTAKLLGSRIQNLLSTRRHLAELIVSRSSATTPSTTSAPATESSEPAAEPLPSLSRLDQEFMERLDRVISENIMTEDLDMPFMTDKMAMSHSTFYRKVKALTGMTAKEYIRKYRLRHCYQLLESGDYNVTEAAMMTGFNQMAHFRDIFKKEFGIAPSEVLKKKRQ